MAIFDNIKNIFVKPQEIKKEVKEAPVVYYSKLGYDTQSKISYQDLATDGYSENAIVNRCINEIATNASRVKINLFRGDQEIDTHPLLDLIGVGPFTKSHAVRVYNWVKQGIDMTQHGMSKRDIDALMKAVEKKKKQKMGG